jgi:hypothetical protein
MSDEIEKLVRKTKESAERLGEAGSASSRRASEQRLREQIERSKPQPGGVPDNMISDGGES